MTKSVSYNGITFLHHEESYQVRKNKTGTIKYYTQIDTGESGMSLRGLANACGVALSSLQNLLEDPMIFMGATDKIADNATNKLNFNEKEVTDKTTIYFIKAHDLHVIRDTICERVIYYYAFESRHKKSKARELYQSLAQNGLRSFIHGKTGYQATQAAQHDNAIAQSIEAQLRQEVEALRLQLVEQGESLKQQAQTIQAQAQQIEVLQCEPRLEKTYQAYLHDMIGGTREFYVSGPYPGRVDIATDQFIVEVKPVINFEKAFGQLLRYRAQLKDTEHASKAYTIFLFGSVTEAEREVLETMAQMTNFQLMIHKDLKDYVDEDELTLREKIRVVA